MKKSAFTLIELLVVISIIAILAGIALPVFQKTMEKSRATTCGANLHQIGIGIAGYLADNDDQMFPLTAASNGGAVASWPVTLHEKYLPDWKIFRSPFDLVTPSRPQASDTAQSVPVSYGINTNTFDINASKFKSTSQLIVMSPLLTPSNGNELRFDALSTSNPALPLSPGSPSNKQGTHTSRSQINVLFADSRVASIPWIEYADISTPDGLKRWYPKGEAPQ
ncbi:MAG: hypothetical protein JWL90_1160 [Chthoniobacteraceae bacterium]|nr:hypothetical protein [Chthoniobacteraceae bacterium]